MKAEDSQPNEASTIPKGGNVPTIQSTLPPKSASPNLHRSYSRPRYARRRNDYHHPYSLPQHVYQSGRQHAGQPTSSSRTVGFRNPILTAPVDVVSGHPTQNMPLARYGQNVKRAPASHPCSSATVIPKRESAEVHRIYGTMGQIQNSDSTGLKKQRLQTYEEPTRERHEIVYDIPESCKGDGKKARRRKREFIRESVGNIRRRFDATIHSQQVDHGKLTINYSYEIFESVPSQAANRNASHIEKGKLESQDMDIDVDMQMSRKASLSPSGSNTKLEDMEGYLSSSAPGRASTTGELTVRSPMLSEVVSGSLNQKRKVLVRTLSPPADRRTVRMHDIPYRPFRSGTLSLNTLVARAPTGDLGAHPEPSRAQSVDSVIEVTDGQISTGTRDVTEELSDVEILVQVELEPSRKLPSPTADFIEIFDSPSASPVPDPSHDSRDTDLFVESDGHSEFTPCIRLDETGEEYALRLRREERDKPRRLLFSRGRGMSYLVSIHATVYEISHTLPRRQGDLYRRATLSSDLIEDACFLPSLQDDVMVLAQSSEENALSLVFASGEKRGMLLSLKRPSPDPDRRLRGASAIAPLSDTPLAFVSGGYDHAIHLWTISPTFNPDDSMPKLLDIKHSSTVQSLLPIDDTSRKLLSAGADCCVNVWDLSSERALRTIKTSNSVYHLHKTERPECVLLEVAHRDSQFELHDYRTRSTRPAARFGFHTLQLQGRYTKGDVKGRDGSCMFMSGSRDGRLRLWDLRRTDRCTQEILCFSGQRIVHAAFDDNCAVAVCEDNRMLFYDII